VVITFDDAALDTWSTAFPILRRFNLPATLFVPTDLVGRPGPFWWNRLYHLTRAAAAKGRQLEPFLVGAGLLANGEYLGDSSLWRRLRLLGDDQRQEALERAAQWVEDDGREVASGAMDWSQLAELDDSGLITLGAHTATHPVLANIDEELLAAELTGCRDALSGFHSYRNVFAYPYGDAPAIGIRVQCAVREAGFEAAFTTDAATITGRENPMVLGRFCVDDMSVAEFAWTIDYLLSGR
jgi:peptidoglycan/xylan/chitin deacetylase (PgdA/CDA1 family)